MTFSDVVSYIALSCRMRGKFTPQEMQRRIYLYICSLLAVPMIFSLYLTEPNAYLRKLDIIFIGALLCNLFIFRFIGSNLFFIRAQLLIPFILIHIFIVSSRIDKNGMLWTYICPLISFYLLGCREGAVWNTIYIISNSFFLCFPHVFSTKFYTFHERLEVIISLIVVALFSYWLEHVRSISKQRLADKNRELITALDNVKTLQRFIPICSYCKNIKDDKGYWNEIETYIEQHSDAIFQYGLCEECAQQECDSDHKEHSTDQ